MPHKVGLQDNQVDMSNVESDSIAKGVHRAIKLLASKNRASYISPSKASEPMSRLQRSIHFAVRREQVRQRQQNLSTFDEIP